MKRIEQMLNIAADMQKLSPKDDRLTKLLGDTEDELDEFELDYVAAASSAPNYASFLSKLHESK